MNNKLSVFIDILASLCIGIGFLLFISLPVLYWFIHGDYDRYVWIIHGPFPFGYMGSGPFMLLTFFILIIGAAVFLVIGGYLRSILRKHND